MTIYDLGLRGHFQDEESNRAIEVGLDFSQLQDSYATSERKVTMDGIYTPLNNDEHQVDIKLSLDFTTLSDTLVRKLNNYLLKPRYQYFSDNFAVVAALNIFNHRDVFNFYPDLEVKAPLSGNQMVAVLGVSGGLLKNDYHSLYRFNNFIQSRIDTLANTGYFNYYAGLEGSMSGWQYSVRAGWKQMDNFALFKFEKSYKNAGFFRVLFDDVNATYIQIQLFW